MVGMWLVTAVIIVFFGRLASLSWNEYNRPQAWAILGAGTALLAALWTIYSVVT